MVWSLGECDTATHSFDADPATRTFGYDGLNRLTGVAYPSGPNEVFSLDLAGNRTGICTLRSGEEPNYHEADVDNQYVTITPGETDPNYDEAGNLATDHRGYAYSYDHDNRLVGVQKNGVVHVGWMYDALGRRIGQWDMTDLPNTVVRYYMHSGQNVVEEYDGAATRLRYFVHGPTYIDERVVMHDDASERDFVYLMKDLYTAAGLADDRGWPVELYDYDAYGGVVMQRCAAMPYAADFDGDGDVDDDDLSVFASHQAGPGTEPNGVAGWRADLDCDGDVDGSDYVWFAHAYAGDEVAPRGDESLATGPMAVSRSHNPYFFTGRRLDAMALNDANTPHHFTDDTADLQLYYYRARTMHPVVGRFLQRDPIGYADGMNLYEYVGSNPCHGADPLGLAGKVCCKYTTMGTSHRGKPYPMGKHQSEINSGSYSDPAKACKCVLGIKPPKSRLDSASAGGCCSCTVEIRKNRGSGPVIPGLNWWAHEKVRVQCTDGRSWEAEVFPKFDGWFAGPGEIVVGPPVNDNHSYWTEQSTTVDCDCAGGIMEGIAALNGTSIWYNDIWGNCTSFAQSWYDSMDGQCWHQ